MHDTASELAGGALAGEESAARVAKLHDKLAQISLAAPKMAGLVLFLETVHAAPSARLSGLRASAEAEALAARALSLAGADSSRFAQAGVLAVAAVLAHQRDVSPPGRRAAGRRTRRPACVCRAPRSKSG